MDASGSFNWRYLQGLAALIRRENVDLIQSHLLGSNVYCSLAGLLTRKPVVATFHGAVDIGENERLKGLKFGAINLGARCIIAVSDSLRENIVPGIPTLERRSHDCVGVNASSKAATPRAPLGVMMTRGFAGLNSCLVLSTEIAE